MSILLMLIGIPGSGKSTWLFHQPVYIDLDQYKIINEEKFAVVCPDNIRKTMSNISDQSNNAEVWKNVRGETIEILNHATNVVIDATNVNTNFRKQFIKDLKCELWAKVFHSEPALACNRIKNDIKFKTNRANVPDEVVYKMYGEFLYTLTVLELEGFKLI